MHLLVIQALHLSDNILRRGFGHNIAVDMSNDAIFVNVVGFSIAVHTQKQHAIFLCGFFSRHSK